MPYATRVVLVRFKEGHRDLQTAKSVVVKARHVFPRIPGVTSFHAGVASDRRPDFDVVLLVGFDNEADIEPYRAHPTHTAFVDQELKPIMESLEARNFITG